jgi:hypothetical protein
MYTNNLEAEFPAAIHIETVEEAGPLVQVVQPLRVQQLTPGTEVEICTKSQSVRKRSTLYVVFVVGSNIHWFVLVGRFCSAQMPDTRTLDMVWINLYTSYLR